MTAPADTSTIAAISTPPGEGGVGLVRLSGPRAVAIGRRLFRSRPALGTRARRVEYGEACDAEGRVVDAALAWYLRAPRSYTGEDMVEISTHGSDVVLEGVLAAALRAGAQQAGPGEFTRRAFANGRLDLLQAEAVIDVIQAGGRWGLDQAYGHLQGRLSRAIDALADRLTRVLVQVEVGLDFPDEDAARPLAEEVVPELDDLVARCDALLETFEGARRRQGGHLVALVGRPNVGKSTLFNALLGEERAIVTALPGTTRDLVEGRCVWAGEAVRLVDTAGLRGQVEAIEAEGVARARATATAADVVVAVLDGSSPWTDQDDEVVGAAAGRSTVWVCNKGDLPRRLVWPDRGPRGPEMVAVSALCGTGLEALRRAVSARWGGRPEAGALSLTRQRHHDLLSQAREGLWAARQAAGAGDSGECAAAALHGALGALGGLLGRDVGEEVLNRIFSEFCIGK